MPRLGLSPTSPQHAAGTRIEPPASVAWAIETIPEATAAAAPPDDPPEDRSVLSGLRHLGPIAGSLASERPNSGLVVTPNKQNPLARQRAAKIESSP